MSITMTNAGVPADPTTPACSVSKDHGTYASAAETPTVIGTAHGHVVTTFSGAETAAALDAIFSAASGADPQGLHVKPRALPVLHADTAQAGGNGSITLAAGAPSFDLAGCIVRTTGGTGGGSTGGANNQARVITAYNGTTKVATISPNWETNPANDTTYDILLTELAVNCPRGTFLTPADYAAPALDVTALLADLGNNVLTAAMLQRAR